MRYVLTRLNQIMHGWANFFRHALAKNVFAKMENFAWWGVIRMLQVPAPLGVEGRPPPVRYPQRGAGVR
jgi:hypothetical protein